MRIAAGVLIIIIAVINFGAGSIYTLGGGVLGAAGVGMAAHPPSSAAGASSSDRANSDPATAGNYQANASVFQAFGGIFLLAGMALLTLCGLEVAAGVLLFIVKNPIFVHIVAGLQIAASALSMVAYSQPGFASIFGIITGSLALWGARIATRERRLAHAQEAVGLKRS